MEDSILPNVIMNSEGQPHAEYDNNEISADLEHSLMELESQKKFLRSILDAIPEAVFIKNKESKYSGCNKAFREIFAFSKDEDIIGKMDMDIFKDVLIAQSHVQQDIDIMRSKASRIVERAIKTPDCVDRNYETIKTPYYDEQDEVAGVIGIARDVTQRKLMEINLRESEERYSAIVNSAPEIVVIHKKGIMVFINDTGIVASGYQKEEIIGHNFFEFITEESRKIILSKLEQREMNQPVGDYEIKFITKPGRKMDLLVKTTPINYEKEPALLTVMIDISSRSEVERKLRESEMRLSLATSSARIGLWDWDVHSGNAIINEQCAEMIGYTIDELKPINITSWQKHTHPDDLKITTGFIERCFSGEIDYFECEIRIKHKNGEWVWLNTRSRVIEWDDQRKPSRFVGTYIDISKQKQVEEELEQARKSAEAANILKSRFLSNMSHEIRTPLNGILGFLNLLENTDLTNEQQEFVQEAKSVSDLLLYIINDILDFSKIDAGKLKLEKIPLNFRSVIEDTVSLLHPKAIEKKIGIEVIINENVPEQLLGDPVRLRQILNNLLSNAVKFTSKGKVVIIADKIHQDEGNVTVQIQVKDTGIGISKEDINKLFKPFAQADTSTTRKYGGSGLGLVISNQLANLMGGEIHIESTLGTGSIFTFSITFETSAEASVMKTEAIEDRNGLGSNGKEESNIDVKDDLSFVKPRILLVEDNEINIKVVTLMLEKNHLDCDVVMDGSAAVEAVSQKEYDIIFMDCQMPVMDGYASTIRIRELEGEFKHTPIIALTANAMGGDREKCIRAGMDNYISKPIHFEIMLKMIKDTMKKKQRKGRFLEESLELFMKSTGFEISEAKELFSVYLNLLPGVLEEIQALIENNDYIRISNLAHKTKGSSGTLKIQTAFDLWFDMETSAKNQEKEECLAILEKIRALFDFAA